MLPLLLLLAEPDTLRARVAAQPGPVARFIRRRAACNHFAGEEPYDAERAAFLARTVRALHCDRLDADEARLRKRYRDRPDTLALIAQTADALGGLD